MKTASIKNGRALNKKIKARYKALVGASEDAMWYFKNLIITYQKQNDEYSDIVRHHEDKLNNIKIPGVKLVGEDVEQSQAVIKEHKHLINRNKKLIKWSKRQALNYWQHLNKYQDLFLANRGRKLS